MAKLATNSVMVVVYRLGALGWSDMESPDFSISNLGAETVSLGSLKDRIRRQTLRSLNAG